MMLTFIKCSFVCVDRENGEYVIFEKIEDYPERIKEKQTTVLRFRKTKA